MAIAIINIFLVYLFGHCLYLAMEVSKKMYGGRFSSALPPFVGGITLLFLIQLLKLGFASSPISTITTFRFSVHLIQIVAGLLFLQALYHMYRIGFATSGFRGFRR